ncbi:hypothetical protein PHYC_02438 [Phycisphaerales bacterium]|nr:hypothetical protein PHYC_02438 [Phycisphaerales bacterium]
MSALRAFGGWCALVLTAVGTPGGAQPEPEVVRPQAAGRLVKVFDFEEWDHNPGDVPELWYRAQDDPNGVRREGFPSWNQAVLVYTRDGGSPFAGEGAVRVPTRGGSTSLILAPGGVPVFQNADYRLSVRVRTEGLKHSGAALAARFLDRAKEPIVQSESRTPVVRSEGQWTEVSLEAVGRWEEAAWLQLELLLLQPQQASPPEEPDPHRVWEQDFSGAAWFDHVEIIQLPRVEITSGAPGNVVAMPAAPTLSMMVRDLTGERLTLLGEVQDVNGAVVARDEQATGYGVITADWRPDLPGGGWYRGRVRVMNGERQVDEAHVDFVWLHETIDPSTGAAGDSPFGLEIPEAGVVDSPALARRMAVGGVTLPAWTADLTPAEVVRRERALSNAVTALLGQRQEVTMSLPVTPSLLAGQLRVDPNDPLSALLADPQLWEPFVGVMLEKIGPRVSRWQIGVAGNDLTYWRRGLGGDVAAARDALSKFVPAPRAVIGGRIDRDWEAAQVSELSLLVPRDLEPTGVRLAAAGWARQTSSSALRVVFEPGEGRPHVSAPALARQVVEFWAGTGEGGGPAVAVSLRDAWDEIGQRRPQLMPRAELCVWRTLNDQLGERKVVGEFPVADGVRCYILAPTTGAATAKGAALVAWNEAAPADEAVLREFVGEGPVRVTDIYGNSTPAPEGTKLALKGPPGIRVDLTDSPVFIEGIDLAWCRFLATLRIEPPTLDAGGREQERTIVLQNTWAVGLAGSITILEPGGLGNGERDRTWRISPRAARFHAGPGEAAKVNLTIGFSPVEEAGPRDFVFDVEIQSEGTYGPVQVRRRVEIGTPGLRMDLAAMISGNDAVVDAVIGNTGQDAANLRMTAYAPGVPRAKAAVNDLPAGNQTIKRFRFADQGASLRGQRVMVSVEDPETGARLVRSVLVR